VHHLEPRVTQISVRVQLLPGPIGTGVLERAVCLGDRRVLPPQEVDARDRPVVPADPYLQLRRRQAALVKRNPRDRLERRLG
jgi:hypothetical protein